MRLRARKVSEICRCRSEKSIWKAIARFANGDARTALNTLEMAVLNGEMDTDGLIHVDDEVLAQCMNRRSLLYDKNGEEHYNLISALHKSMRNSDPDAPRSTGCAGCWTEERIRCTSPAAADPFRQRGCGHGRSPRRCPLAVSVYQACHFLGMPECDVHLTPRGGLSVHGAEIECASIPRVKPVKKT